MKTLLTPEKTEQPLKDMPPRGTPRLFLLKQQAFWIVCVCLVPLYVLGFISLFGTGVTVLEREKRPLKEKPMFTWASYFSGAYTRELGEYYSDAFPLRNVFMDIGDLMGQFYYFSPGENSTLIVKHPGLNPEREFPPEPSLAPSPTPSAAPETTGPPVSPGSSEPVPPTVTQASPTATPTPVMPDDSEVHHAGDMIIIGDRAMEIPYAVPSVYTRYADIVATAARALPEAQVYVLTTPNAGEFYSPISMHTGASSQKDMIAGMYEKLPPEVRSVDAYGAISRHTDEYLYFRTDHHWTALGAYYAYTAFCAAADVPFSPLNAYQTGQFDHFVGSMYGFTAQYPQSRVLKENPDTLIYYLPLVECKETVYESATLKGGRPVQVVATSIAESYADKYVCFIDGNNPLSVIETDVRNGRSIMVVKESYGNAFVPFLTSHYQTIYIVDPRFVNGNQKPDFQLIPFVRQMNIDDVLFINYPFFINHSGWCDMLDRLTAEK